jgi:transcriptional antiterminator
MGRKSIRNKTKVLSQAVKKSDVLSSKEIAEIAGVSIRTVDRYIANLSAEVRQFLLNYVWKNKKI